MEETVEMNPLEWTKIGRRLPGVKRTSKDAAVLPEWVDPDLLKEGREFVKRNLFSVLFAHLLSLLFLLCYKPVRSVLLKTGKSHGVKNSKIRYFSTLLHIKKWYESDLTDTSSQGLRDILRVRAMHVGIPSAVLRGKEKFKEREEEAQDIVSNEEDRFIKALKRDLDTAWLQSSIQENNNEPLITGPFEDISTEPNLGLLVTQLDMAVTQFCFFGFPTMFRKEVGIHKEREKGVLGFLHLWALIGHFLGIQPEYNLALPENEGKRDFVWKLLVSDLRSVDAQTYGLWKWLVQGVNFLIYFLDLEALLLFAIYRILKVPKRKSSLWGELSLRQLLLFHCMRLCFSNWFRNERARTFFHGLVRFAIWILNLKLKWNIHFF